MAAVSDVFEPALDELVRERCEIDGQEAAWLVLVGEYHRSHDWQADGFLSAAAAFLAGEISREHARVIANAYTAERSEALGRGGEVRPVRQVGGQ